MRITIDAVFLQPRLPITCEKPGTQEFIHSWSDMLGGICRSGFAIEDVTEPDYGKADSVPEVSVIDVIS